MQKILLLCSLILCVAFANAQTSLYAFAETTGNTYTSISLTGTLAASVSIVDDDDEQVNIGFTFVYNGNNYTQMHIGSNGYSAFGANHAIGLNGLAATFTGAMEVVAPYWDDLNPSAGGNIYYETQGTAPNRVFIVEYNEVQDFGNAYYFNFQFALYESSNNIEFRYGTTTGTLPAVVNASIGINEIPGGAGHFVSVTPNTPTNATVSITVADDTITNQPADGINYLFYIQQVDLAVLSPQDSPIDTSCGLSSTMEVPFFVENTGLVTIPAGDTIFGFYQVNAATVVLDTFVLSTPLVVGDTMFALFTENVDFSAYQLYDWQIYLKHEGDFNFLNDTAQGDLFNMELLVDLGNDTTIHPNQSILLDASSTVGEEYLWNTTATTPTITIDTTGLGLGTFEFIVEVYSWDSACYATDTINITFDYGIGVEEYDVQMNIYPNPNNGTFTLVLEANTDEAVLSIMNLKGQIIREEKLNGDLVKQIDMSAESKGIYFIRVMTEHTIKVERVVLQ